MPTEIDYGDYKDGSVQCEDLAAECIIAQKIAPNVDVSAKNFNAAKVGGKTTADLFVLNRDTTDDIAHGSSMKFVTVAEKEAIQHSGNPSGTNPLMTKSEVTAYLKELGLIP